MSKIAFVTGLNGFVGQHLKQALEQKQIEVIGIPHDIFYTYEERLPELIDASPPDYIFHLASYGNMFNQTDDDETFFANTYATYKLIQATRHVPYKAFVNVSTSSVLLEHQTLYSATKMAAESISLAFSIKFDLPIISVRPFSLYGENEQETHLIPRIFRSCLYGEPLKLAPEPRHDWVYVKDFVQAMITLAEAGSDHQGMAIQCGTGVSVKNASVLNYIERITRRSANIIDEIDPRPYDTQDWKADPKNGMIMFASTMLEEGLQKVYQSYKL